MPEIPEPKNRSIVVFCHPDTGDPEDAYYRDDAGARAGGYGQRNWYPVGRTSEEPPETWAQLLRDQSSYVVVLRVTAAQQLGDIPMPDLPAAVNVTVQAR
jgi:hypothetical protein